MNNAVRHNSIYSQVIRELRGALVALWWSSRILIPKMQGESTHTSSFVGQNSVDNLYRIFILYLFDYSLNCKVRHREVRKTAKFGRFFI